MWGCGLRPQPPHMPVLFSRLTFFSGVILCYLHLIRRVQAQGEIEGIVNACVILTAIRIMYLNVPERLSCAGKHTG